MTDEAPEDDAPELAPSVTFDSARLIADVRRGDDAAISEAYRLTFGSDLGRVVLLHALAKIGQVGAVRGDDLAGRVRAFHDGTAFAVLEIARKAGFDPTSIAASVMTNLMEGARDDHGYGNHHHDGNPGVVLDDGGHDDAGGQVGDEPEF